MIRLRTIDVWDTLLRRRCHPDAVKLHVARYLLLRRWEQVAPRLRDARTLLALRLAVERDLAAVSRRDPARDDEYALRDVLATWVQRSLAAPSDTIDLLDDLGREELAQEHLVTYADPTLAAKLRPRLGVTTLFVSDFYVPATDLAALLDARGFAGCFDGGASSCDVGLNKRSGRLFEHLHREQGVTPVEHEHLGDNPVGDVRTPRRLGIKAKRHRPLAEERVQKFNRRVLTDRDALVRRIRAYARASAPALRGDAQAAFRFGIDMAPLFVGFGLFLLESMQRDRIDRAFFLTREGAFFADLYALLRNASPTLVRRTPPPQVLEVSRRSTFAASLGVASIESMQRLWSAFRPSTLRAWAWSLNLDPEVAGTWGERHRLVLDESVDDPAIDPRVIALFADAKVRAALDSHLAGERRALAAYLREHEFGSDRARLAVVDIGWRGTIQDNLAALAPSSEIHGLYLGLQRFLNAQPPNTRKRAYGPDLNLAPKGAGWFRKLPLIEMLCTPPIGSPVGYERIEGRMQAIHADGADAVSEAVGKAQDVVDRFQAGVRHGVANWAGAAHWHALGSEELNGVALAAWKRALDRTPMAIARARATLAHDERFGRGVNGPPPSRSRLAALFRRRAR